MPLAMKRVYLEPDHADGFRILVDRLWPRGLKKEDAALDEWAKEVAPSPTLRKWFGHEPARWDAFRHRYASELDAKAEFWRPLATHAMHHKLTLLFGARDEEHNGAVALKAYLDAWLKVHGPR